MGRERQTSKTSCGGTCRSRSASVACRPWTLPPPSLATLRSPDFSLPALHAFGTQHFGTGGFQRPCRQGRQEGGGIGIVASIQAFSGSSGEFGCSIVACGGSCNPMAILCPSPAKFHIAISCVEARLQELPLRESLNQDDGSLLPQNPPVK